MGWDVRSASLWYRALGWNPLPSSRATRHPISAYSHLWDVPIDRSALDDWPGDRADSVQVMCGGRWGLAVVDLDGPGAIEAWRAMTLHRPAPATWTVRTGSGGIHLYYKVPDDLGPFPRVRLWQGVGRHEAIEVLGDRCLVTAPPSPHHRTGEPYRFTSGPSLDSPGLASLPRWLVAASAREADRAQNPGPRSCDVSNVPPRKGAHFDRRAVLSAIRDKLELVRSWGLRVCGRRPSSTGWITCHSLFREDKHPSAGFNRGSGYYSEPADRLRLSLFEVGVTLGVFRTWVEACNTLGEMYL